MREVHVFFMYAGYPAFDDAALCLRKPEEGKDLLEAYRLKLHAMHLTKGSSPHVRGLLYIYANSI